ncbi:MAG: ABC transporter ATP-binding protein [Alkalispirochaeta sp.]
MNKHTGSDGIRLHLTEVAKSFPNGARRLQVLQDIGFDLEAGQRIAVTGESGSGKSTLLSLIAGLDTPDHGSIQVGPHHVEQLDDEGLTHYRSRVVGLVFQFHYLLQDFTALENVMLPALMISSGKRDVRRDIERRATDLLESVGLGDRLTHMPAQLSGGERQRVALARALVNEPPLILADEPTGNLDDRNSRMVEDTLFSLVADRGRTLILVTHNRELAQRTGAALELEAGCLKRV